MPSGQMTSDHAVAWITAMRDGNFDIAWELSDLALRRRQPDAVQWSLPRHLQQIWTGSSLSDQRVLVRCYHGLGDTIQFIRFAALLRREVREVIVWAQGELLPLIQNAVGVDRCLPLSDGSPDVDYDQDIEIMELPHALRINLATLPHAVPYLCPPQPARIISTPSRTRRVGLVWRGGNWDPRRSIPIESVAKLAGIPGIALFSLQQDAHPSELALLGAGDFGRTSITELAAHVSTLDLVISVDTMAAHLAGALGRRTWTMLHADCDWRWMAGRRDTPWYPTMRLFRQPSAGDWDAVIDEVAQALNAFGPDKTTWPDVDHTT